MVNLTLGGVVFANFEIPETINFGGAQALAVHKMPGGSRTIDAMGPDDADIRWSGRFRGSTAEERAFLLDFMRRAGNQLLLSWGLHRYQVVIREFTANFQQSYEIPYSISCTVLIDETQALAQAAIGFIEAMASDVTAALGLSGVISDSTINNAVTGVAAAFTNYQAGVPNTTNALTATTALTEGPLLSSLQTSITGAQTATQAGISSTSFNAAPVSAGGSPSGMASSLSSAATSLGQLGNLYQLSSVLGRMNKNVSNVGN